MIDNDDNNPGGGDAPKMFTADQVSSIVKERLAKERQRAERRDTGGLSAADVAKRAAAFARAGYDDDEAASLASDPSYSLPTPAPKAPPPPRGQASLSMPSGSPPARVITDDTPLWQLSPQDRAALVRRVGPFEFKKRLVKELRDSGATFSMRRR